MLRRSDTAAARSIENGWIYLRKIWKILLLTLLDAELIHCHCNRAFSQGLCAFETGFRPIVPEICLRPSIRIS